MKILQKIEEVKREIRRIKQKGKKIGFVPTMGYLHQGHLSLIKKAGEECDYIVVSIFVNPTQFGPREDYRRYPRDLKRDFSILKKENVNLVFVPGVKEMYPEGFKTWVIVEDFSERLEGKFRPGHFRGVCTVVLKLFNIVEPDRAYFGWKDAQQLIIIKKMVKDLNISVDVIGCPTVREKDGLAASSRNTYLSLEERKKALCLYKSLQKIKEMVEFESIKDTDILLREGRKIIERTKGVELQYLEAVDLKSLNPVKKIKKGVMVVGAIKIGKVRLIDNIIF